MRTAHNRAPLPPTGTRWGSLTFTGQVDIRHEDNDTTSSGQPNKRSWYECRCDCDVVKFVRRKDLIAGHVTSCGCGRHRDDILRDIGKSRNLGPDRRAIRSVWGGMIERCVSERCPAYPRYGGRGIHVCVEWQDSFDVFFAWAVGSGFAHGLTLDRIDNNGHYEPSNCRWTTHLVQNRNRRDNVMLSAFGETKCLSEWVEDARCEVKRKAIDYRLSKGMNMETAMKSMSRGDVGRKLGRSWHISHKGSSLLVREATRARVERRAREALLRNQMRPNIVWGT